jgi:hypothetical protein
MKATEEERERIIEWVQREIDSDWFEWLESYLARLDEIKVQSETC